MRDRSHSGDFPVLGGGVFTSGCLNGTVNQLEFAQSRAGPIPPCPLAEPHPSDQGRRVRHQGEVRATGMQGSIELPCFAPDGEG